MPEVRCHNRDHVACVEARNTGFIPIQNLYESVGVHVYFSPEIVETESLKLIWALTCTVCLNNRSHINIFIRSVDTSLNDNEKLKYQ